MVIAVASFAVALDPERRQVGTGIGSAAPTPVRAGAAEEFLEGELASAGCGNPVRSRRVSVARFAELVASAAAPIDDVRGSAPTGGMHWR